MDQEKIGKYIKKLRTEKKMTQQELADKLLVDRRTISRWENGNYLPDISLMKELCKEFNISIDELLHISKEQQLKNRNQKIKIIYVTLLLIILLIGVIEKKGIYILFIIMNLFIISIEYYIRLKDKIYLTFIVIITIFLMYTFFTYSGAVRFMVFTTGHPIKAYTYNIVEMSQTKNNKCFYLEKRGKEGSDITEYIIVKKYWIIKIPEYYGRKN